MSLRTARALAIGYFIVALIAVTWPVMVPFARIHPLILGLPFGMGWIMLWVIGAPLVLWLLDRVERRHRRG